MRNQKNLSNRLMTLIPTCLTTIALSAGAAFSLIGPGGAGLGGAPSQCPRCGATTSPNTRFCTTCGTPLSQAAPAFGANSSHAQLLVVDGPNRGQRFPLGQQVMLGRSTENDIRLDDEQASRQHALIQASRGSFVISDLNSRNGTFVNGTRISQPTILKDGELVGIGETTLRVIAPPAVSQQGPAPVAPAYNPEPPRQAAYQSAPDEPVVGIIPAVERKKGLFGSDSFNLILTHRRLVFARLTSDMIKAASAQAKEDAKEQGKGFFGQWGAMISANSSLCERYYQMPIDAILREHPDNFAIAVDQIKEAKSRSRYDPEIDTPDELIIQAGGKHKFTLKGCSAGQAKKTLQEVLGKRAK